MAIYFRAVGDIDGLVFAFALNSFIVVEAMGILEPCGKIKLNAEIGC